MAIGNKPQGGELIVGDPLEGGGLPARPPFQQFIDDLVDQVNGNLDAIDVLREEAAEHERQALEFFVSAGYGGIGQSVAIGIPNISSALLTVPADANTIEVPRFIRPDLDVDGLGFVIPGVWNIAINLSMSFVDINAGRTFDVEVFNLNSLTTVAASSIFIGRNQAGVNFSIVFLVDIPILIVNDILVVRIGNAIGGDFTGVTLESYIFDAAHVSNIASFEQEDI